MRTQGFGLFVAVCNRPVDRARLIEHLAESMPGIAVQTVSLSADTADPLEETLGRLDPNVAGPVMLVGLENAVPSTVKDHPVLHALNLRRQEWPEKLPRPVVFWVPEYLLGLLGREAPDFLDWRNDTVHFDTVTERDLLPFRSAEWAGGLDEYLPTAARRERIRELRSRLAVAPRTDDPAVLAAHADWMDEIGNHHRHLAEFSQAKQMYEEALEINHRLERWEDGANTQGNLAGVLMDLGDLVGAKQRMEQAIRIEEKNFPPDHPTLGTSYSNLAVILAHLGDLAGAKQRIEQAIRIDEKDFPRDHPNLGTRYSNLAMILKGLGDLAGAKQRMEQAIRIEEKNFPPDHPTLGTSYSNLALILTNLGDLAGAKQRMEQAIAIHEKNFPPDHPDLGIDYQIMAGILMDTGALAKAARLIDRAAAIFAAKLPPDHRLHVTTEQLRAEIRRRLRRRR
ncbi:MAG: tetratricopeptide repeat protein [Planctomycetota bacterium]